MRSSSSLPAAGSRLLGLHARSVRRGSWRGRRLRERRVAPLNGRRGRKWLSRRVAPPTRAGRSGARPATCPFCLSSRSSAPCLLWAPLRGQVIAVTSARLPVAVGRRADAQGRRLGSQRVCRSARTVGGLLEPVRQQSPVTTTNAETTGAQGCRLVSAAQCRTRTGETQPRRAAADSATPVGTCGARRSGTLQPWLLIGKPSRDRRWWQQQHTIPLQNASSCVSTPGWLPTMTAVTPGSGPPSCCHPHRRASI